MSEMVYVGEQKLVGEVIALDKDMTTVQVYGRDNRTSPGRGSYRQWKPCIRNTCTGYPE